jgi:hypothetical protein
VIRSIVLVWSEFHKLLPPSFHNYLKHVLTLYSTSPWFILCKQTVKFVFKFLCFNWIFGVLHMYWKFHVSSSCYNSCKIHVSTPSNDLKSKFQDHFMTYFHVSIVHVFVCLCFNIPIHSKQHSSNNFYGFPSLCVMFCIFHMCHVLIGHGSPMFHVLGLLLQYWFFCFLSCRMIGRHLRCNTFKQKCWKPCIMS